MPSSQAKYISCFLSPLHLKHRAQRDIFAQWLERFVNKPGPRNSPSQERKEQKRQDIRFPQRENADHKEEEYDNAPNQTDERYWPGLSLRFVGFVEN